MHCQGWKNLGLKKTTHWFWGCLLGYFEFYWVILGFIVFLIYLKEEQDTMVKCTDANVSKEGSFCY